MVKIVIKGEKPEYMNGVYNVIHDGKNVIIFKKRKNVRGLTKEQIKILNKTPIKNLNIRDLIFKKLGLEMSAIGTMYVPRGYKRRNFKGLTFKKIAEIQKKY